jgi:hypothetical protein
MPYIKLNDRFIYGLDVGDGRFERANTPGHLNFQITELIKGYWETNQNYQGINDIIGALEGAKLEFYRRVAAPYEDKKIKENGDVYN